MLSKNILSLWATVLSFIAFFPYFYSIFKNETKPHVMSWAIWGLSTGMVFFAQLADGGGAGAWPTGFSALLTFGVAFWAYRKKGQVEIKPVDWVCLGAAFLAILIWMLTADPFWAVLLVCVIDILGFIPTLRKSYHQPYSENLTMYGLMFIRNIIAMLALEHYSPTTLLFPMVLTVSTIVAIPFFLVRRWKVRLRSTSP